VPPANIARHVTHAGLLLLAAVAAGSAAADDPLEYAARTLIEAGSAIRDGTPMTKRHARGAAADTCITLVRLGALARDHRGPALDQPTRDGAIFARAALRAWPG
jgi:hypothetical protein